MRNECNIVRDLLPLYAEDIASADSRAFVEEHLAECEACRRELAYLREGSGIAAAKESVASRKAEAKLLKKLARQWNVRRMLFPALLAVSAVMIWSWFHVSGSEIDLVKDIHTGCTVTVASYEHMKWEERVIYTLEAEQILRLRDLLLSTTFVRDPAKIKYGFDEDQYDIRIDFNNGQDFLGFSCAGDDHLTVSGGDVDGFLNIHNKEWRESLLAILAECEGVPASK